MLATETMSNQSMTGAFRVARPPEYKWECAPTGDFNTFRIMSATAPNAFHRLMQRLVLGVKYRKITKP
jgi:hypothetical protein